MVTMACLSGSDRDARPVFVSVGPRGLTGDPTARLRGRATYGKDAPVAGEPVFEYPEG
jgi:hypothetical protein